eukprot:CAMPEP_0181290750 /NCGR_PEP_ID=MMETSP1101-20121128/1581_1 /TAXON_ID=46948 /ORGANISM="Rhodomonas abbreviata, Strain Caron Lab Isolate" /LENGTH=468 /DNA_ID=CAMNT_0023395057 /DNA_START=486 /DNA_END=1888 /DNA_ORIENTATION=-
MALLPVAAHVRRPIFNLLISSSLLSPALRWALLPGADEEEDAKAYCEDAHRHLVALHEHHGDAFVQRRKGETVLFVRSPRLVRGVLQSGDFGKVWVTDKTPDHGQPPAIAEYVHNLVLPLLADPLFSHKGATNKDARSAMSTLFGGSKTFATAFTASIETALDSSWPSDGGEVDALELVHDAIRGALYQAIAGRPHADKMHTVATPAFRTALEYFVMRYQRPSHDQAVTADDEVVMTQLHTAALDVVAAARADTDLASIAVAAPGEAASSCSLVALMLDAGCTDAETAAVVVNTVIAGAEAPASALAHLLRELARRPDLQQQLRDDIKAAAAPEAGGEGGGSEASQLAQLPLVKACVLEGLRLFAPATLVKRQALRDTIVDGHLAVPKGTVVELCITAIHQDPKQYARPLSFDPLRLGLTAAPILGRERCFMPFSAGPRGCPGRPLALTLMRIALVAIVRRFVLAPAA